MQHKIANLNSGLDKLLSLWSSVIKGCEFFLVVFSQIDDLLIILFDLQYIG